MEKDNILIIPQATKQGYIGVKPGGVFDCSYINSKTRRGRVIEGGAIAGTLTTNTENCLAIYEGMEIKTKQISELNKELDELNEFNEDEYVYRIRKLTPRECFRLMGVDEENIDKIQASGVSKTQQYKMAGNSIVVDCLYYIFRNMFTEVERTTLF